jgi:hypothetical protein
MIYQELIGDATLMGMVTGVFDHVDQQAYPYVVIGEDNANEWDTDTERGTESVLTIHTWSRYKGLLETKEIQQRIYEILHRRTNLTIDNAIFYSLFWETSISFIESSSEGETRHGVMTFRLRYDNLAVS